MYDHTNRSPFSFDDNVKVIGKKASLTLTGEIIDVGESEAGSYVHFKIDDRWGFGGQVFIMDRDPFEIQED